MTILFILGGIAGVLCLGLITYVVTRPGPPKKYPIFKLSDTIEDHYLDAIGQLRSTANDSLAYYANYNPEAYAQLIQIVKDKLEKMKIELDNFDTYWQHFSQYKVQATYVSTCKSY